MLAETIQLNSQMEAPVVTRPISSAEAAQRLGVSTRAVTDWCKSGAIKGAYKLGEKYNASWVIPLKSFEDFARQREEKSSDC